MKETTRTMIFVAVAVASVALATAAHFVSKPHAQGEFGKVGTEYYPEFVNPNDANAIKVVSFDEATAEIRSFEIRFDQGRWSIPSHHNYPADGKDRLAKTAASIIGAKRGALASRYAADHERYGVIDPMNTDVTTLTGRGQRITLTRNDEVLADYIIGKPVEGDANTYYVRNPREDETYRAALTIDLSTKFADWIEPDLLLVDRGDMKEIVAKKFEVGPQGQIVDRETTRLTHDPASSDWKLDGLNAETEELKADDVRKIVGNLDELRIVGVRPKPGGLNADLTIDRAVAKDPLILQALDADLRRRGFVLYQDDKQDLQLASTEGAVFAKSSQGIVYALHFGEVFTGDEKEIEVGGSAKGAAASDQKVGDNAATAADASKPGDQKEGVDQGDPQQPDAGEKKVEGSDDEKDKQKRNRYLFVSVEFDPKLIGEPPVKPTEPQKPAEPPANAPKNESTDATPPVNQPAAEGPAAEPKDGATEPKADSGKPAEPGAKPEGNGNAKDPKAEYEFAVAKYKEDLNRYEDDLKQYDTKVADGRKKFDELKARFGGWYYVISAENFETLRLARADLVKPKEKKDGTAGPDAPQSALPEIPDALKQQTPPAVDEPAAGDKPAQSENEPPQGPETPVPGSDEGSKPPANSTPQTDSPAPKNEEAPSDAPK